MKLFSGIGLGTGGTRALLVDHRGTCAMRFTAAHEDMRMERPLWAEQRPENWWDAVAGGDSRRAARERTNGRRCARRWDFRGRCTG